MSVNCGRKQSHIWEYEIAHVLMKGKPSLFNAAYDKIQINIASSGLQHMDAWCLLACFLNICSESLHELFILDDHSLSIKDIVHKQRIDQAKEHTCDLYSGILSDRMRGWLMSVRQEKCNFLKKFKKRLYKSKIRWYYN